MSEEFDEIEGLLKGLKPEAPSGSLKEKIRSDVEFEESNRSTKKQISWIWVPLGMAACLAFVFASGLLKENSESEPKVAIFDVDEASAISAEELKSFELLSKSNALVAAEQSPVFYLSSGVPAREVYLKYVETFKYQSSAFAKPIVVTYPREEIRIIPAIAD